VVKNPVKAYTKKSGKSLIKRFGAWLQIIKKNLVLSSKVSEKENRRNFLNEGKLEQKYGKHLTCLLNPSD